MTSPFTPGIAAGRLPPEEIGRNFSDLHAPFDKHEAHVAADRCYFCHDAPCVTACPTSIDIPLFIRQIATGQPEAAGVTIFEQNIFGGMCARVCPTEELCEEVCVREVAEGKPVEIGRLQRYATDSVMTRQGHPFVRAADTGKRVAVVGAGPAGLACAHRLAMQGHKVDVYEMRDKPGGLNEYGIAAYKTVDEFAQAEVDWLLGVGGIEIHTGVTVNDSKLAELRASHDVVFLGIGLPGAFGLPELGDEGVTAAIDFIAALRQSDDLSALPVGRHVVVIGGGMTAIDAAVQAKALGADSATILYRRDRAAMPASDWEQDLAAARGVRIVYNAAPVKTHGKGAARELECERTVVEDGRLVALGDTFRIPADQVLLAIGQWLPSAPAEVALEGKVLGADDDTGRTSLAGVWAGGDCVAPGKNLTVWAVRQGRDAAEDIHAALAAPSVGG
ncbi:NADPH-dependent glutamate synthase beta chain and related oxidoreductase [Oceanicola granulosus HTCC2516]|uniref:dihydrouracil dehydrogenase (NAD(+)) n=1 Tax=Oceanicola granulosus (strain ATCC BAA-861 / DSM 15982 / KCTC 12143 / HTCC2516) TaxID=314256 RepID=Q2CK18_OCEGH|nr:NAD(P)-dependent oxidoreductase [Oceanicola granulosus]EAR52971.1 NADPH-dependent glutamate synthase beta chain and related oxidoreductase [Oceanicola granulosus HTCC2516]